MVRRLGAKRGPMRIGFLLGYLRSGVRWSPTSSRVIRPVFVKPGSRGLGNDLRYGAKHRVSQAALVFPRCGHTANADHNADLTGIRGAAERGRRDRYPSRARASYGLRVRRARWRWIRALLRTRPQCGHVGCGNRTKRPRAFRVHGTTIDRRMTGLAAPR